ncbi:MAG: hypothetical protein AB8B86_17565 [Pseudomonadales bacterium]
MNKSTTVLLVLAALGLGSLIGISFVEINSDESPAYIEPDNAVIAATDDVPMFRFIAPGDLAVEKDAFDRAKPSAIGENFIGRDKAWKTESMVIELPIDGAIEYKAIMDQGDTIIFDWKSDRTQLYTDFHGHDKAFGDDFFVRYEEAEGMEQSGMIVAAFSGEHGWYWLNAGDGPTTVTLRIAGFFEKVIRIEIEGY